jgi:hypothetical protein
VVTFTRPPAHDAQRHGRRRAVITVRV